MKNKLKLSILEVESFVTKLANPEELTLKGGSNGDNCRPTHISPTCPTVGSNINCEIQ